MMGTSPINSRLRTGYYAFEYTVNSTPQFANKPVRGVVLAYISTFVNPNNYWIPFLDTMFSTDNLQGNQILPQNFPIGITTEDSNIFTFTDAPTINTGNQSPYYFMEAGKLLTMNFNMIWASPCAGQGVTNC
jgi:hypothetical protein